MPTFAPTARRALATAVQRPRPVSRLEREAQRAARRVVGGEHDLGAGLTPTQAASARVPGSPGVGLPSDLLGSLERAFGAGLSAVRIHRDAAASTAARARGARAFTAGRDIYFAAGARDLDSEPGRELAAHEVAHVLQQTGRRDGAGRLRATAVEGTAEVQCDSLSQFGEDSGVFVQDPAWDDLVAAHGGAKKLGSHLTALERIIAGASPVGAQAAKDLGKLASDPAVQKLPATTRSFYVDAMKWAAAFDAARTLLLADPTIATAFRSRALYDNVLANGLAWIVDLAKSDPLIGKYYPGRFVWAYRNFFFGPWRPTADLDPQTEKVPAGAPKTFTAKLHARIDEMIAPGLTTDNELTAILLIAMNNLDASRKSRLEEQLADAHKKYTKWSFPWSVRDVAHEYATKAENDPFVVPNGFDEPAALYAAVAGDVKTIAARADGYWKMIYDAWIAAITGKDTGAFYAGPAKSAMASIGSNPRFAKLGPTLARAAKKVLARTGKKLLDEARFADAVKDARELLRKHAHGYTAELVGLARDLQPTSPEAIAIGQVLWQLGRLEMVLTGHPATAKKPGVDPKSPDARLATQIRFADQLGWAGQRMGLAEAVAAADRFYKAGAQIALLGAWEPVHFTLSDAREHIRQYGDDEEPYDTTTGVTWGLLRAFLDSYEFESIALSLERTVPQQGTPALGPALKAAVGVRPPRRWIIREHEWTDPILASTADRKAPRQKLFHGPLTSHPLTADLLARERTSDDLLLVQVNYPGETPLTLTLVPGMAQLMRLIHNHIGPQVEAAWKRQQGKKAFPDPANWRAYRDALAIYVGEMGEQDRATHVAELRALVKADRKANQERAWRAGRKLTSHDRGLVVATVQSLWKTFKRRDETTYDAARQAWRVIGSFASGVYPEADRRTQLTALALETYASMKKSFGSAPVGFRGDAGDEISAGTAWGLLAGAIETWEWTSKTWSGNLPADDVVEMTGLGRADLDARMTEMRAFLDVIAGRSRPRHEDAGVIADASAKVMRSVKYKGFPVKKGEAFQWGDIYLIIDVHQSFTYHPPVEEYYELGVEWRDTTRGSHLVLDGSGNDITGAADKLFTFMRMAPDGSSSETVEISARDLPALALFSRDFGNWGGVTLIGTVGKVIEGVFNAILEIAEFIPGIGQGIAIGRFVLGVLDTLTNPEFHRILDLVARDGLGVIVGMFEEMMTHLHPEDLLSDLLFEADLTSKLRKNPKIANDKAAVGFVPMAGTKKDSLWERVARVLKNIAQLGIRILDAFKRLAKRAQVPFRAAQLWVLSHPAAGLFLELASKGLELLASMSLDQLTGFLENPEKGWQELLASSLTEAAQEIVDRGRDMVDVLRHLELPAEIVPVELIVDFFVEMVVTKIGSRKAKGIVKGGKFILEKVGLWGKVNGFISNRIRQGGLDPNQFYRDTVVKWMQPKLEGIREGFIKDLLGWMSSVPFLGTLTEPPGTPVRLANAFGEADFPEAQSFATSPPATRDPAGLPMPIGGVPLVPSTRRTVERAWGHDLSHVRLHTGADASRVTSAFGAEGLTTGSHVFLRPGLAPSSEQGARVLRHELAHVVQQTGPRPVGGLHSSVPVIGAAGRGLVWDGAREAEAERAAHAAGAGDAPSSFGSVGAQPLFGVTFMKEFFKNLGSGKTLITSKHEVLKQQVTPAADLVTEATRVVTAIKAEIDKPLPATKFVKPFDSIHDKLIATTGAAWHMVTKGLPVLVARSTMLAYPKVGEDRTANPPKEYLDQGLFELELRRFLFAVTGLAWVVQLKPKPTKILAETVKLVDDVSPILSLGAGYLHLPLLEPSKEVEELWDLLVENSFGKTKGYSRTDATKHLTFKIATKLQLGKAGPQPGIYESSAFKLKKGRIDVIVNQVDRIEELAKSKWPTPTEYAEPLASNITDTAIQDIGLRVGLYQDWDPDKHPVIDRDPHHITQFLVVEYFRNVKGAAKEPFPFKESRNTYPGVGGSGHEVDSISSDEGTVDVAGLFPGRGGPMPTILLARPTHQSGLHFKASKPKAKMRASQAGTVHNTYTKALRDENASVADAMASKDTVKALGKEKNENVMPKGLTVTPLDVKTATVRAVRKTYASLRDDMLPLLKEALVVHETRYYDLIASRLKPGSTLTAKMIEPAYDEGVRQNKDIVEQKAGFQKP